MTAEIFIKNFNYIFSQLWIRSVTCSPVCWKYLWPFDVKSSWIKTVHYNIRKTILHISKPVSDLSQQYLAKHIQHSIKLLPKCYFVKKLNKICYSIIQWVLPNSIFIFCISWDLQLKWRKTRHSHSRICKKNILFFYLQNSLFNLAYNIQHYSLNQTCRFLLLLFFFIGSTVGYAFQSILLPIPRHVLKFAVNDIAK